MELIQQVSAIIGEDGISDDEIERRVAKISADPLLSRRLIDWIPEAFGMVLASHIEKVELPSTFSARNRRGEWVLFEFDVEPIFALAIQFGVDLYHSGPREEFANVALRSSVMSVVNKALGEHGSIKGGRLSGPAMIGVRAETYISARKSIWARLFT